MVAKNVCYLFLFHVFIINSMEHDNGKQLAVSVATYDTFTPREVADASSVPSLHHSYNSPREGVDISSIASLHLSCNPPQSVNLSLDLNDGPQEEITELDDNEVSFLVKACKFTKLKDVSKKRAKAVIKENVGHPKIQKIISMMREQKTDPKTVHIDHDKEAVRAGGVDLGVDVKDIHKISYDLARLMWKRDHTCCGRTISQTTGQKIIAYGLTGCAVGLFMSYSLAVLILNLEQSDGGETINNYYYNCTNGTNSYLG
jgi:hypothetical protein